MLKIYGCSVQYPEDTWNGGEVTQTVEAYVVASLDIIAISYFYQYVQKNFNDGIEYGDISVRVVIPENDLPDNNSFAAGQIFPMWLLEALWQDAVALRGDDYDAWKEQEIIEEGE